MDKEKNQSKQTVQEEPENNNRVKPSSWKRFLNRKWVYPAIYLASAALIIALIFWFQDPNRFAIDPDELLPEFVYDDGTEVGMGGSDAIPVANTEESFVWPVASEVEYTIGMAYYDDGATDEVKAAAVIQYSNGFWPHTGIDLTIGGNDSFTVVAAGSGIVTRAENDPVVGYIVEIDHGNQLFTSYSSMQNLQVTVGDEVSQGDTLGEAGRNEFEKDMGVHLHFEIYDGEMTVNPLEYLPEQG